MYLLHFSMGKCFYWVSEIMGHMMTVERIVMWFDNYAKIASQCSTITGNSQNVFRLNPSKTYFQAILLLIILLKRSLSTVCSAG